VPSSTASSPYHSPVVGPEDRGRSPVRLSKKSKGNSPRGKLSSPLARVAEETPQPIRVHTDLDFKANAAADKLISVDTPRPSDDFPPTRLSLGSNKENKAIKEDRTAPPGHKSPIAEAEELKTVEI
jgi:hypothetical protein